MKIINKCNSEPGISRLFFSDFVIKKDYSRPKHLSGHLGVLLQAFLFNIVKTFNMFCCSRKFHNVINKLINGRNSLCKKMKKKSQVRYMAYAVH